MFILVLGKRLESGHVIELSRRHWLLTLLQLPIPKALLLPLLFGNNQLVSNLCFDFSLLHDLPIQCTGVERGNIVYLYECWWRPQNDPSGNTSGLPSASAIAVVMFHTKKLKLLYVLPSQFPTHRTGSCVLLCLKKLLEIGCWIFYRWCFRLRLWG